MTEFKKYFASSDVKKNYRKARKTLIDKGKKLESGLIKYLESEIAPSISVASFDNELVERDFYAKISTFKNAYSMFIEFERNNFYLSDKEKSLKLIKISKVIADVYSDIETRYLVNNIAKNLYEDELILSSYIWTCIHTERYIEAARNINYLSSKYKTSSSKLASFKQALSVRLPNENIDNYLLEVNFNKEGIRNNSLKIDILDQADSYIKFYKEKKYKEIASLIFTKYENSEDASQVIKFMKTDLRILLSYSTNALILIMINTAKEFSEHGKLEIETSLVEEFLKLKINIITVRAAFWSYFKQGNAMKSREALNQLELLAKDSNDEKQLEFIKAKRKAYLFIDRTSIGNLIDNAVSTFIGSYDPVPNKIAYVLHNTLPYASGGYATRGHGLGEAIQEKGFEVVIIGRPGFPLDIKREMKESEVLTEQNIDGLNYTFTLAPRRDKTSLQEFIELASEELTRKFIELKPSIVVAASNHLTGLPALIAAKKLGIPFVYEVRGFWEITRISREPEFAKTEFYKILCDLETIVADRADQVFTLTTPMLEELESRGISRDKITLLPNSCNPDRFEPKLRDYQLASVLSIPNHVPVIGYIGTFVQYEGLDHLAEACGLLKSRNIEFRLLIVGNENTATNEKGPITQKILEVAKLFNFEDWLIMPGRIPHEEVEAYYSLIDVAPFPRKPQPVTEMVSPMKPLEAAAMKKAIVVSSVRALTDMITNEVNGLVFEKGNVPHLAKQLERLIADKELRQQLGENARIWVETERTWSITANTMKNALNQVEEDAKI